MSIRTAVRQRSGPAAWAMATGAAAALWLGGCDQGSDDGAPPAAPATPVLKTSTAAELRARGQTVYRQHCLACHQADGGGVPWMQPPLAGSAVAVGEPEPLVDLLLRGIGTGEPGALPATGEWSQVMTGFAQLDDPSLAAVLTWIRSTWGNDAPAITAAMIAAGRDRMAEAAGTTGGDAPAAAPETAGP